MKIKLIVIDIDGTLLDSNGSISIENKLAIKKAQEKNVQIVLCTGRPIRSAQYLLAELDLLDKDDLIITSNGGLIQQAKTGKILNEVTFNREESLDIYRLGQKLKMPITFIDLDYVYEPEYPVGFESVYTGSKASEGRGLEFIDIDIDNLSESFEVHQIIMSRPEEELEAIIPKIPSSYYEKYNIYKSLPFILEFLPKKVDKGYSMHIIAEKLGLKSEQIMGIGDQENDLSLVENAGLGVAMGNAIEEVKMAADYITKSNDCHGVAHAIQKFILNN